MTAAAQKLIKQSKYRRGQSLRKFERRLKDKRLAGSRDNQALGLYADDAEMEEFQETKSPKVN